MIKQVAADIVERLIAKGFIIQRYDSYSTDSTYLKLDYGVCNSIRISNHPGKAHLKYRYNVIASTKYNKDSHWKMDHGFVRNYYPYTELDIMFAHIIQDRQNKLARFGPEMYRRMMRIEQRSNEGSAGFWSQARLISMPTIMPMIPAKIEGKKTNLIIYDEIADSFDIDSNTGLRLEDTF